MNNESENEQINYTNGTNQYTHMNWILKPELDRTRNISKGGLAISSVFYFQNK